MPEALLIDHPPVTLPDRVTGHLEAMGFDVCRVCPGFGDDIPNPASFDALVLLGGGQLIGSERENGFLRDEYRLIDAWLGVGKPMVGFGLGAQAIAHVLGANVGPHYLGDVERGYVRVVPTPAGRDVIAEEMRVFTWHSLGFGLPFGAVRLAASDRFPNQAARFARHVYGFQFRPDIPPATQRSYLEQLGADAPDIEVDKADLAQSAWLGGFLSSWLGEAGLGSRNRSRHSA